MYRDPDSLTARLIDAGIGVILGMVLGMVLLLVGMAIWAEYG